MRRRLLQSALAASAAILLSPLASPAFAQTDWPTKPIKLLVPYPPGGALDPVARAVAQRLSPVLGQPIIVENRPGANTAIAAVVVAKGEPDGYTLLFTSPIAHVIHTIQTPRGYDAIKDFASVAAVSRGDYLMAVHPSVPATTLTEFIAWGRANPDKISAGAGSSGNAEYLGAEMFKLQTGIKLTTIPYKGSGPALIDLLAGRTQMMITSQSLTQQQIEAGKLRMLAFTFQPPGKPPVPTFAQAGIKGFDSFGTMNIVLAHRNTPAPIIAKLAGAIKTTLEMPEVKAAIAAVSQEAFYMPPRALHDKLEADHAAMTDLIKIAGIKFD